jgi:hypothetical protein
MAEWAVDLVQKCATAGGVRVSFYRLASGGFSIGFCDSTDKDAPLPPDQSTIQEAIHSIARTIKEQGWPD